MPVNLRPHSATNPLEIDDETYQRLVITNEGGWSRCADETEWLAKLHYLRSGFEGAKLDRSTFEEREYRLVYNWLRRFTS
jgi:hypothetical protein